MDKVKNNKISYIAQAQLIGCILVIFGHSYPLDWNTPYWMYLMEVFIYLFHMPLFFFISGYLFYKTVSYERYGFGAYIKKRSIRLMLPYVSLTLIGFIPKVLMNNYISDNSELSLKYLLECFLLPRNSIWGHFWFLPTLLIVSLFSFVFAKFKNKTIIGYSVLVFALFLLTFLPDITGWFCVNDILDFIMFYALGILFANSNAEKIFTDEKYRLPLLLLFPISISLFLIKINNLVLSNIRNCVIGVLMILFVLTASQIFDITVSRFGKYISGKTYSVFILSWPFQCVFDIIFENVLGFKYYITMPIAFVSGIVLPIITIIVVDKIENKIGKKIISPIIGG